MDTKTAFETIILKLTGVISLSDSEKDLRFSEIKEICNYQIDILNDVSIEEPKENHE